MVMVLGSFFAASLAQCMAVSNLNSTYKMKLNMFFFNSILII